MMKKLFAMLLVITFPHLNGFCQSQPPNIIIFIADDVSWDDFGCYGNPIVQTPNIDYLAAEGMKFTNFYLTASSCSPSRNSIMTGRYPHNSGAAELHTEPPLQMLSLAELIKKQNYYTVQAGKFHMGDYARRGFDVINEDPVKNGDGGENLWVKSLQERPKEKPFFMWFAAYDAHRVWGPNDFSGTHNADEITPPFYLADGDGTKTDLGKYYDEIKRFDYFIGQVNKELKKQGAYENTMIIVMADNGRPFPHSKTRVNDRGMKTPFIIHWPDRITDQGSISHSLVSAIDIAPTLLQLAGLAAPEQFQGISFENLIANPDAQHRNYVFAEHNWHDYEAHERMVRDKNYMYILNSRPQYPQVGPADAVGSPSFAELNTLKENGELSPVQADIFMVPRPNEELYDCNEDPLQLLNLASVPDQQAELMKLRNILVEWMAATSDNIPLNLTRDWYLIAPDYIKTEFHGIREEMPGAKLNATENNNKGKY